MNDMMPISPVKREREHNMKIEIINNKQYFYQRFIGPYGPQIERTWKNLSSISWRKT